MPLGNAQNKQCAVKKTSALDKEIIKKAGLNPLLKMPF